MGCFLGGLISDMFALKEVNSPNNSNSNNAGEPTMSHGYTGMKMTKSNTINSKSHQNSIIIRLWILVIALILSFPCAAGILILNPPLCYWSYFLMYFVSEMWISVAVTLVLEFAPKHMRNTFLSVYYFTIALAGYAPLAVTPLQMALNSYFWAIFIMFPFIYGTSAIWFFLVIFTYKRDLQKNDNIV